MSWPGMQNPGGSKGVPPASSTDASKAAGPAGPKRSPNAPSIAGADGDKKLQGQEAMYAREVPVAALASNPARTVSTAVPAPAARRERKVRRPGSEAPTVPSVSRQAAAETAKPNSAPKNTAPRPATNQASAPPVAVTTAPTRPRHEEETDDSPPASTRVDAAPAQPDEAPRQGKRALTAVAAVLGAGTIAWVLQQQRIHAAPQPLSAEKTAVEASSSEVLDDKPLASGRVPTEQELAAHQKKTNPFAHDAKANAQAAGRAASTADSAQPAGTKELASQAKDLLASSPATTSFASTSQASGDSWSVPYELPEVLEWRVAEQEGAVALQPAGPTQPGPVMPQAEQARATEVNAATNAAAPASAADNPKPAVAVHAAHPLDTTSGLFIAPPDTDGYNVPVTGLPPALSAQVKGSTGAIGGARGPASPVARATAPGLSASSSATGADGASTVALYEFGVQGEFDVVTAPRHETTIVLAPGEAITSPVQPADPRGWELTLRWVVLEGERRAAVVLRPTLPGLSTNLSIATDQRTYFLRLYSQADAYMPVVRWLYPRAKRKRLQRELDQINKPPRAEATVVDPGRIEFSRSIGSVYRPPPDWMPTTAYVDELGKRTFLQFDRLPRGDRKPALFGRRIRGSRRAKALQYESQGNTYVIEGAFEVLELRAPAKSARGLTTSRQDVVRIRW